jgi:hypothetical protein
VIGRVLKQVCGYTTIIADIDSDGHAITESPWHAYVHWGRTGRSRGNQMRSIFRGLIMTLMAGAEAEIEFFDDCLGGDSEDRKRVDLMLRELLVGDSRYIGLLRLRQETRLRRATRGLVRRHRDKIDHVATQLLERKTLQDEEIDAIVGIVPINKAPSVSALAR